MRLYAELNRRLTPMYDEVVAMLEDDANQTANAERNQVDFKYLC
jgi:hypothetical protein